MKRRWSNALTENLSYKIVALFISLILWLTILGRRDFILSKDINVDLVTAPGTQIVAQSTDHIKVKVSGPRTSLKKFLDSSNSQSITLDISKKGAGVLFVDVPLDKIETPMGVRILGIRPTQIQVEVVDVKGQKDDEQKSH
ncbi:MAG: CdaR family protein [Bdellovibrio sp.]